MHAYASIPAGQHYARTRWNTHESGAAFDRKKTTYLTEQAREFIAQQSFYVIARLGPQNKLDGWLVMGEPGCVSTPDEHTCILRIARSLEHIGLQQGLQQTFRKGHAVQSGLFFISHATRERLCVQGRLEMLLADSPDRERLPDRSSKHVGVDACRAVFFPLREVHTYTCCRFNGARSNQPYLQTATRSSSQ